MMYTYQLSTVTGDTNPAMSPTSSVTIVMIVVVAILFSVAMVWYYRRSGKNR